MFIRLWIIHPASAVNTLLTLVFNEIVQKGTGNILVKENGIVTQTIDVASASVIVAGNTVTIDAADLTNSAAVNIEIAAGAFKDFPIIIMPVLSDATTWNFAIVDADITPPVCCKLFTGR